ncbi:MAG: aminotransferase class I/II-fold pyridoxal phosphate-dependent enzyme [Acidimicrobiales bacterium]|jgi:succinyldiaminopimelate transaminase|nr:aminotransferase class I/II-fold pyridoxal phosphate-dependent enzyme [Acidimicrobiales bacterium]HCK74188.1 succinyldiaminopimelate transaminase [Acidimicrobiaceae bacterium]|tara:strand:- start:8644 stop:9771 length:1128 start_codon:yes stop_codon:yes gene_type:complete
MNETPAFIPPPYPYDRLDELKASGERHPGGLVDCSIGTPIDPPPASVVAALSTSETERSYPPSIGTEAFREQVAAWSHTRFGVRIDPGSEVAAAVGTKEFVAGLPHWMKLRNPSRDTVLYPAVSYPSYEMGATLAGCRAVAVPVNEDWSIQLESISEEDAKRALLMWVNTPGNPAGGLDDLEAVAEWGRRNDVPVFSDECYCEFTWDGPPRTILSTGSEGVVSVHSLSKRSNLAGLRVGFYSGDADIVNYLREIRKHAGFMVPGPAQAAAVAALSDQDHVENQRTTYLARLERLSKIMARLGVEAPLPRGGFYLWVPAPEGDAWLFVRRLIEDLGLLASPGEFYGKAGAEYVRIAAVQGDERIALLEERCTANVN